jgi:hypothetical protein
MATQLYPEPNSQFLARMIVATREGHQISSRDAIRLDELAQFGAHGQPTTMPEARTDASKPLQPITQQDLVTT